MTRMFCMTNEEGGENANVSHVVVGLMNAQSVQQSPVLRHICEMYMQNMHNIPNILVGKHRQNIILTEFTSISMQYRIPSKRMVTTVVISSTGQLVC